VDLRLVGGPEPGDRALDLRRHVLADADARLRGHQHHDPGGTGDRQRAHLVGPEHHPLDRHGGGRVRLDRGADGGADRGEAAGLGRAGRGEHRVGPDDRRPPMGRAEHGQAGPGEAGVDAEHASIEHPFAESMGGR
jgi:hypothetical protein